MLNETAKIRLRDLEIFEEVARAHSIREVARRLNSTSGQISKAVQNLEKLVGTKLFKRSVSGVLLTSQGAEFQLMVREILTAGERIETLLTRGDKHKFAKVLAVAGTSFLNTHFTAPLVCRASKQWPSVVFRFLDLAPDQMIPVGMRGGFELALHFGRLSWPATWTSVKLGKSHWVLCARANHDLPVKASLKQILEYPFVVPTYWTSEGLVRGNDQFPLPLSKRKAGFESSTADASIPILLETNHLAFLPHLLAQPFLQRKLLKAFQLDEIDRVEKELFLSAKSDDVPAAVFEGLREKLSNRLL